MYDLSLIKQRISCVDVAQRCGLPIHKSGDRCVSPLRPGATNPSSFVVDDDFWYDFGDARGGDQIDLLAEIKFQGDRGAAIRHLAALTGVTDSNPRPDGWVEYTQNLCNTIAHWQTQLTQDDYDYLHSRGLNDDTISSLRLGRTDEGRLCIPYTKNGYVAYYCTRYLQGGAYPESKYRKMKRDDYNEHIVWGLDTLPRSSDTLIIAEGVFDSISFYQDGYPVISAITGFFSRDQIPTVLAAARKFDRVLLVYDNDLTTRAGEKFTNRMAELLTRNRIPFVVGTVPQPYHDVSEFYAAGGRLTTIIDSAQDGTSYIASTFTDFADLERFIYTVARHTKRSKLDSLLDHLKRTSAFDPKRLDSLFRSATTAPPENIIADEILKQYQLVFIPAGCFYEYSGGVWVKRPDVHIKSYADRAYGEFSTAQRINAICNLLKTRALRDVQFNKQPVWNFVNGTLELETGVFRDHNPSDYCSVQTSYPYDPEATYSNWSRFIRDVASGEPKTEELLQFIPGYALFNDCFLEKVFVLTGMGGNGKTVYLKMLEMLFGSDNVSHITPRGLLDRFQRINLKDSIINLAGEIKSDLRESEEYIKQIASGESISACYKSQDYIDFTSRAKLVFACNGQPSSGDTSDGLTRRLVMIDFKTQFVDFPDQNNPYQRQKDVRIMDKLIQELNSGGIFNWAYEGYKLLKKVGYFTETADQEELMEEFNRASNPVLLFYEEKILPDRPAELTSQQLFSDYKEWCIINVYKPISSNAFFREFKKVSQYDYEPYRNSSSRGYRLL